MLRHISKELYNLKIKLINKNLAIVHVISQKAQSPRIGTRNDIIRKQCIYNNNNVNFI